MHFISESNTEHENINYIRARLTGDEGRKELLIMYQKEIFKNFILLYFCEIKY